MTADGANLGVQYTDTFNRSGETADGWLPTTLWRNVAWDMKPLTGPLQEASVKCLACGNVVTMREGDDPIPFGDSRLCEHFQAPGG